MSWLKYNGIYWKDISVFVWLKGGWRYKVGNRRGGRNKRGIEWILIIFFVFVVIGLRVKFKERGFDGVWVIRLVVVGWWEFLLKGVSSFCGWWVGYFEVVYNMEEVIF